MKTIQIVIDEDLLRRIDAVTEARNRSAFFREAAELLLREQRKAGLEEKEIEGYRLQPIKDEEFSLREGDRVWPD